MAKEDYSQYGFIPDESSSQKEDYSQYGFIPDRESEESKNNGFIPDNNQHPEQQTLADRLGGGALVQFGAGMANMSPIGLAAQIYNQTVDAPRRKLGEPVIDANNLTDSLRKIVGGMLPDISGAPKIPEFGEGGAYTGGEVAGLGLGGLGAGKLALGKIGELSGKSGGKIATSLLDLVRPKKMVEKIKDTISNNLEKERNVSKELYEPINEATKGKLIYDPIGKNNLATKEQIELSKKNYTELPEDQIKSILPAKAKKIDTAFRRNPTFELADSLKKQLGTEIRSLEEKSLKESGLSSHDRLLDNSLHEAKERISKDINSFLGRINSSLPKRYSEASTHHFEKIVPNERADVKLTNLGYDPKPQAAVDALRNIPFKSKGKKLLPNEIPSLVKSLEHSIIGSKILKGAAYTAGAGGIYKLLDTLGLGHNK